MAIFDGTLEEFMRYMGPRMRNVVCNMTRAYKKDKVCQGIKDGRLCAEPNGLEAAHVKGKERPKIIEGLLNACNFNEGYYKVDMVDFETKFIKIHQPLEAIIIPMCKECHDRYDKRNHRKPEIPIPFDPHVFNYLPENLAEMEENEIEAIKIQIAKSTSQKAAVLAKLRPQYPQINSRNVSYSRISEANGLWNFDVDKEKFEQDFYFVFYDQLLNDIKVAMIPASTFDLSNHPTKNEYARFFVTKEKGKLEDKTLGDLTRFMI